MTLEEFVTELLVDGAHDTYAKGLTAILEPYRSSIENFLVGVDPGAEGADLVVKAMWTRLEESDPALHRQLMDVGTTERIT